MKTYKEFIIEANTDIDDVQNFIMNRYNGKPTGKRGEIKISKEIKPDALLKALKGEFKSAKKQGKDLWGVDHEGKGILEYFIEIDDIDFVYQPKLKLLSFS